jgi:hypothetical protein
MRLTEHFSTEELAASNTAAAHHIDNTPPADVVEHLHVLAEGLELVRALLAQPMHINSGFRCEALNKVIGGVSNSAHQTGYAADFVCPLVGAPIDVVHKIQGSDIKFDQLIQEGTWVHISFAPTMRQEVLTAHFHGGKATYSHGA